MKNMKSKTSRENSFVKIVKIPYRVLCRARDFYVRSITDCTSMATYRPPQTQGPGLPKSYSMNSVWSSESDDFRELLRASSTRSLGSEVELELYLQQQKKIGHLSMAEMRAMPRSSSVAMGKIDEEKPCSYFGEAGDQVNLKRELQYPRSKSHAVTTRKTIF